MLSVACGEKMIAWMDFRIGDWLIDKGALRCWCLGQKKMIPF